MHIEDILHSLSVQLGIDIALDDKGACRLVFDGNVAVDIEADERDDTVYLHTAFPLPGGDREPLYAELLRANLFGHEAGGAAFALDEARGDLVLNRVLHVGGMDAMLFAGILESFVEAAEAWSVRLAGKDGGAEAASAHHHHGNGFIRA